MKTLARPVSVLLTLCFLGINTVDLLAQQEPPAEKQPPPPRRAAERPVVNVRMEKRRGGKRVFAAVEQLNAVDRALFSIAEILYQKGEYGNAISELQKVIEQTPDERSKSAAHLVSGHIYRFNLAQPEKAIEEYKQVTGDLKPVAVENMIDCYMEAGKTKEAVAILEGRLNEAQTPAEKAEILFRMAGLYRQAGDLDSAIETYRRVPTVITYEQAMKAQRARFPALERIKELAEQLRLQGRFEEAERLERTVKERLKQRKAEWKEWELKPKKEAPPAEPKREEVER